MLRSLTPAFALSESSGLPCGFAPSGIGHENGAADRLGRPTGFSRSPRSVTVAGTMRLPRMAYLPSGTKTVPPPASAIACIAA